VGGWFACKIGFLKMFFYYALYVWQNAALPVLAYGLPRAANKKVKNYMKIFIYNQEHQNK
jgi:hypothetical protein